MPLVKITRTSQASGQLFEAGQEVSIENDATLKEIVTCGIGYVLKADAAPKVETAIDPKPAAETATAGPGKRKATTLTAKNILG